MTRNSPKPLPQHNYSNTIASINKVKVKPESENILARRYYYSCSHVQNLYGTCLL
jgi:hypothetical protein